MTALPHVVDKAKIARLRASLRELESELAKIRKLVEITRPAIDWNAPVAKKEDVIQQQPQQQQEQHEGEVVVEKSNHSIGGIHQVKAIESSDASATAHQQQTQMQQQDPPSQSVQSSISEKAAPQQQHQSISEAKKSHPPVNVEPKKKEITLLSQVRELLEDEPMRYQESV